MKLNSRDAKAEANVFLDKYESFGGCSFTKEFRKQIVSMAVELEAKGIWDKLEELWFPPLVKNIKIREVGNE